MVLRKMVDFSKLDPTKTADRFVAKTANDIATDENFETEDEGESLDPNKPWFDFDSLEHKAFDRIPSMKAIAVPCGLWVGDENLELAGIDNLKMSAKIIKHDVETKTLGEDGTYIKIPGVLFKEPRLLIVGRSRLLRYQPNEKSMEGIYIKEKHGKGFSDIPYRVARRFLVMLLDDDNEFLNVSPIQLTAKGCFQIHFDMELMKFRTALQNAYAKAANRPAQSKTELWHSMGVFCPKFKVEPRGTEPNISPACITVGYEVPTSTNWLKLCVGKSPIGQTVAELYTENVDWWKKSLTDNRKGIPDEAGDMGEDDGYSGYSGRISDDNNIINRFIDEKSARKSIDTNVVSADLLIQSEQLMMSLGLTHQIGREIVNERYGKISRNSLTRDQLIDFINFLRNSQPPVSVSPTTEEIPF